MSSILDALKKLERERRRREATNPRRQVLDPAAPAGRRRPPLFVLLATAALGVVVGVTIALWRGSEHPQPHLPAHLGAKGSRATVSQAPERARSPRQTETTEERATETSRETQARAGLSRRGRSAEGRLERARERQRLERAARAPVSVEPSPGLPQASSRQGREGGDVNPPEGEPSSGKAPSSVRPVPQEAMPNAKAMEPEAAATTEAEETAEPEESAAEEAGKFVDTGRSPSGVPKVVLGMLQWSPEPSRRFAFISVDGSPYQKLREGEAARGLKITQIEKDSVTFKYESTRFVIRPRH